MNKIGLAAVMCAVLALCSGAAQAADGATGGAGGASLAAKYDTKLPVEISSDNLEVLQRENKAIFKGNVIAVQGKIRLNADKMTVHYKQKPKDDTAQAAKKTAPQKATPSAGGGEEAMGAISHIEVEGHVLVATPDETAQGDQGDYDVEKKFLRLTGDNVILTREQNILRGKAVDYDLVSGHSVLTNGAASADGKGDHRVRGVFVPQSQKK